MLPDLLSIRASRSPLAPALVDMGTGARLTWRDLDRQAERVAWRLREAGVRPGQRVAVRERAGARFAAALHGTLRAGAALVPLNPAAPEVDHRRILDDCRPAALIAGDGLHALADPGTGDPGDACLLYTSGTTGPPKGVRLTLRNHVASAAGCAESLNSKAGDRWLLVLSPHHVGGLAVLFRSVVLDQPVVAVPRFSEELVIEALERERPALVSLVPAMLSRLLPAGAAPALHRCRAILVGGAPAPAATVVEWVETGLPVCASYGMTETCSQVTVVPPGRARELAGTAGIAHSQARLGIHEGMVLVGGPVVSPGYLRGPIEQPLRTGDLGRIEDGVLTVTGRADDTIITGGENVHPEEVEAVLRAHPGVRDAALVGRPDPVWGAVLEALVVGDVDPADLIAWSRERLPAFKTPRRVSRVESLPRSEGGKLLRARLGEIAGGAATPPP